MKQLCLIIFSCLFLMLIPQSVFAHSGGGPPFLMINGKYAPTNPYFLGGPQVPVSQDLAPEKYLVNTQIEFFADTEKLLVPKEIIEKSTFRWSFQDKSTDYAFGTKATFTYPKTGSYMMSLEVKGPEEAEFFLLDTVQIDVVPYQDYQLPSAKIATRDKKFKSDKPIKALAVTTHDPSTTVKTFNWFFSNKKISEGAEVSYVYNQKEFVEYIFLQVIDENGLSAIDAVQVVGDNGAIALSSLTPNSIDVPVVSDRQASIENVRMYLLPALIAGVVLGVVGFKVRRKMKGKQ